MHKQRAKEIAASPVMAYVTFQNQPVYIQHVDEEKETATIFPLDQPENIQEVPLSSLEEK